VTTADAFLSGVILAAGASRRMGRPKQLLPFGDRCLLQHVLDAAVASRLDEVILVLGCCAPEIRAALRWPRTRPVQIIVNAEYAQGQSSSLRLGLRSASPRSVGAAILLGDQPQLTGQLIDRIADAFLVADAPVARPVYASSGMRCPGHPVFLARRIWPEVEQLRGDRGARVLIAAHPDWITEVTIDGQPPVEIDTIEDYQRAVDSLRGEAMKTSTPTGPVRR
jgi:molybdenum cofactor cytidylyltransferase